MTKKGFGKTRRGVAILFTISILGLLSLIGISFALNMLLTRKEAANFINSVKARYIAEAGINRALADMRSRVKTDSYGNLTAYINGYVAASGTDVAFGQGTYTLSFSTDTSGNVISEADKVNINSFDEFDTSQTNILKNPPCNLPPAQVANIIDYRDYDTVSSVVNLQSGNETGCKDQPYGSIEEVKAAFINAGATLSQSNNWFDAIKNYITINKPIMRGGLLAKYFSSILGTSPTVQIDTSSFKGEIVELGDFDEHYVEGTDGDSWDQDSGWLETHDAEFTGGYLIAAPADYGLETFGVIYEGYIEIRPGEVGSVINFWLKVDDGVRLFINGQNILPASAWQDHEAFFGGTYTFQAPGWHRIRIEYYDNAYGNTVQIRWGGADWGSAAILPAERFGYEAPTETIPASATPTIYNNAGNYNITCTAKVTSGTQVLAQKRLSAVIRFFGTWTQTTRDEFYAAWFNDYADAGASGIPAGYTNSDGALPGPATPPHQDNNYRDGEMRNVTWLDSCPLDATENLEADAYATQADSLKLGFWVDFDDDPTYTVCNLKALVRTEKWGDNAWTNFYKDSGVHDFFSITWGDIKNDKSMTVVYDTAGIDDASPYAKDNDQELVIGTAWHENRRFEVNPFYYFPSGSDPATVDGTPDVFMRCWTSVNYPPNKEARAYWRGTAAGVYSLGFQNVAPWNPLGTLGTDYHSIPVVGGVEQIDTPYAGTGLYGWAYDWKDADPITNPDIPDGKYQIGERICKVYPKGATTWVGIYGAGDYNVENQNPPTYDYWQPEIPFTTPRVYGAGERMSDITVGQDGARGISVLTKDNDGGWSYGEQFDIIELTLTSASDPLGPGYLTRIDWRSFANPTVLVVRGRNGTYDGLSSRGFTGFMPNFYATPALSSPTALSVPNFQFLSRNGYDASGDAAGWDPWAKWMTSAVWIDWDKDGIMQNSEKLKRTGGNTDFNPAATNDNTGLTTFWDNIRIIPASGFLVSTPHVARSSTDANVAWGTVSWTEDKPANTDVKIHLRSTGTGLPTIDNFPASFYNNGDQIIGTGRVIQYKTVLTSTAFQTGVAYSSSGGVTPRLDDITITYNPTVQVLYWKEF